MKKKTSNKEITESDIDKLLQNPELWEAVIQSEKYRFPDESEYGKITFSEEFERKMHETFDFLP